MLLRTIAVYPGDARIVRARLNDGLWFWERWSPARFHLEIARLAERGLVEIDFKTNAGKTYVWITEEGKKHL